MGTAATDVAGTPVRLQHHRETAFLAVLTARVAIAAVDAPAALASSTSTRSVITTQRHWSGVAATAVVLLS